MPQARHLFAPPVQAGGRVVTAHITVVGAGVAGLCAATELASCGARVSLLDQLGGPGPGACSWWAGGMLAPFCEAESAPQSVVTLGREAAAWWSRHAGNVVQNGTLVVAPTRDIGELHRFARRTDSHRQLNSSEIEELEPGLAGRFTSALFFPNEAHLNPRESLHTLLRNLRQQGTDLETREWTPSAEPPDAQRDNTFTVDCRGIFARESMPELRGVKGEMVVLRCPEVSLSRPVRLLHPRHPLYIVPRGDGVYMLGATQIEGGVRGSVTARSLLELLSAAYALHPAFGEAEVLELGTHVRPAFPDNIPRVTRRGNVLQINGLFRHGFLLAPAMARQAADEILGGS